MRKPRRWKPIYVLDEGQTVATMIRGELSENGFCVVRKPSKYADGLLVRVEIREVPAARRAKRRKVR